MSEDSLYITPRIRKLIEQRQAILVENLVSGVVPDYNAFLKIRAQLYELQHFGQDVIELIKKAEGSND